MPNITSEQDFFADLYSSSVLKQLTITIFFVGVIFGLMLELGIIWFERNGNQPYRTVINQMFSTISWHVVAYILFVFIPDGIRYLVGPLHATYCDIHLFLKNFLCVCVILTLDCIILLRYIFIFKLSNFAVLNDNLIASFLQMTILLLSFWMTVVKRISVGRMPLNYFMCSGQDPNAQWEEEFPNTTIRKFDTTSILVVISIILNLFVFIRIFLYQRKMEQQTKNIELGRINKNGRGEHERNLAWQNDNQRNLRNIPKSMADLTTQTLCLIFQITFVVVNVAMNRIEPMELNQSENRWLAYYIQIIGIAIAIVGISFQYYVKDNSLREAIWRSLKESFKC